MKSPVALRERLSAHSQPHVDEVDLYAEQHDVRGAAKKNMYNGKTYNSVDNIAQFFAERGMPPPSGLVKRPDPPKPSVAAVAPPVTPVAPPQSHCPHQPLRPQRLEPQLRRRPGLLRNRSMLSEDHPFRPEKPPGSHPAASSITQSTGAEQFSVAKAMAMMRN